MDPLVVANIDFLQSVVDELLVILLYSHIPTAVLALFVGLFVWMTNTKSLVNRVFFLITLSFALWVSIDLPLWIYFYDPTIMMFAWSFFGIVTALFYLSCIYFIYLFIYQKHSFLMLLALSVLMLPMIIFTPTAYNLSGVNITEANAIEEVIFTNYFHLLGLIAFIWILVLSVLGYLRTQDKLFRKQILFTSIGLELFLLFFTFATFLDSYLVDIGVTSDYILGNYGLFGMPVFIGLLSLAIVRYKALDIKLLGAQALVVAVISLVGSQFFFSTNPVSQILNVFTFFLVSVFGYFLVRSVKYEVKHANEMEALSKKLAATNEKLDSANKELERLDQAKSEFLSIASHQLRTPLTVIKGYTSMVQEGSFGKVPPKIMEVLDKVFISTERLISLVESLLNISRIEAGRIEFTIEPVDLADVTSKLVADFQQKAKAKGLSLLFKPDEDVPLAAADAQKVKEVISNLIDNAIKYTPKGEIVVGLHQESQSVVFLCQDTGLGIDPEDLPRLFTKFVRGKGMVQVNTEGTGLGLYFARMVVENMGGRIWAESDGKNKGSRFTFSLPLADMKKAKKVQ